MRLGKVRGRVDELQKAVENSSIAEAKELQEFWTAIMRDKKLDVPHRLKASELQGKAKAVFVDRKEITGKDGADLIPTSNVDLSKLSDAVLEEMRKACK